MMDGRSRKPMTSGVSVTHGDVLRTDKQMNCPGCEAGYEGDHPCDSCYIRPAQPHPVYPTMISFPVLNKLRPTTESCTMKVLEEVGELMQLIGKHSGLNGEKQTMSDEVRIRRTVFEALDVAQSAITMAHTLCGLYGLSLESFVERHADKLIKKGYLVNGGTEL